jgi:hypothetical protein
MNEHRTENCPADMSSLGPDISSFYGYIQFLRIYLKKCRICLVHPETFFSILILELRDTKLDEPTKNYLNHEIKNRTKKP